MGKGHLLYEENFFGKKNIKFSSQKLFFAKNRHKIIGLLILLLCLTSCASISDIVPAGPDKYIVSGSNLAVGASGSQIKTDLYKKASDYCAAQGKIFEPLDTSSVDYRVFRGTANAELTFHCLSK